MSRAKQNTHIAELIVGAMSIDGSLNKKEQDSVINTLNRSAFAELVPYFITAIEQEYGDFDLFEECKQLIDTLGSNAPESSPIIFRLIAEIISSDRFVSLPEASYLSALAKCLKLDTSTASSLLRDVLIAKRSKLEAAGSSIDETIHPQLKQLLSFDGADELVGTHGDSLYDDKLTESERTTHATDAFADMVRQRALNELGLTSNATLEDVERVWLNAVDSLDLSKAARLSEAAFTAALSQINKIHGAYKTFLDFHQELEQTKLESTHLKQPDIKESSRDSLADDLESKLTGVGVQKLDWEDPYKS